MMARARSANAPINTPRLLAWAVLLLGVAWAGWTVGAWRGEVRADAMVDRLWRLYSTTQEPSLLQPLSQRMGPLHGRSGPPWVTLIRHGGFAVFLVAGGAALVRATVPGLRLAPDASAGGEGGEMSMDRTERTDDGG